MTHRRPSDRRLKAILLQDFSIQQLYIEDWPHHPTWTCVIKPLWLLVVDYSVERYSETSASVAAAPGTPSAVGGWKLHGWAWKAPFLTAGLSWDRPRGGGAGGSPQLQSFYHEFKGVLGADCEVKKLREGSKNRHNLLQGVIQLHLWYCELHKENNAKSN